MKKLFSILLMLCLPLLMHSSWAMGMQMTLDSEQHAAFSQSESSMPCHEAQPASQDCADCTGQDAAHPCVSCGLCMISLSALRLDWQPATLLPATSIRTTLPDIAFFSQDYPPSIKPPIHA